METSVAHREEYVRRWKPFKMGKHGYDCIVAAFSHSVLAMKMFLSLIVLIDDLNFAFVFVKSSFLNLSVYIIITHLDQTSGEICWLGLVAWRADWPCNFRPVLKMLKEMGNLRGEQHRAADVPQNCQLLTRSVLSVNTRNWSNIYVSTTFSQCVECTWTNSSVAK